MAGFDSGIKVYFGGDTTELQAAITQAHAMTGKFAKDSAKVFEEVAGAEKTLAEIQKSADLQRGASFNKQIILQREIIGLKKEIDLIQGQTTQKIALQIQLEQKLLQLEQSIAATTAQTAANRGAGNYTSTMTATAAATKAAAGSADGLFASLGRVNIIGRAVTGTLKSLTGIGATLFAPQIADFLARSLLGFSEKAEKELENLVEKTGKAADEAEKRRDKAKDEAAKRDEERGRIFLEQAEVVSNARLQFIENEKKAKEAAQKYEYKEAEKAFDEYVQQYQEKRTLEEKLKQQKLEALKPEERMAVIAKEINGLKLSMVGLDKNSNEYLAAAVKLGELKKDHSKEELALREAIVRVRAEEARQAEIAVKVEQARVKGVAAGLSDEEQAQVKLYIESEGKKGKLPTRQGGVFTTSDVFKDASDATLAEVIRREQLNLATQTPAFGQFSGLSTDISRAQTQSRLAAAQREQDFRRKLGQDFAAGGESLARKNFQGDPLQFERILEQIVKGQTVEEETRDYLKDIRQALTKTGIVTVPLSTPPRG